MSSSSELNKKDEEKIKRNNFFNLSSTDEDESDNEDEKTKKWDWTREENKNIFYSEKQATKRFKPDQEKRISQQTGSAE